MDNAVLYLRLSKEDLDKIHQGDESESIQNQRLLLTDYAIQHNFHIVDVYTDDNYSGLYDDRPEFNRLIRDSKLGKFNIILAKSQSRFSRNMEHIEKYLHHDFMLLGIRFIGVLDGVDTYMRGNKKARQINGLVNEWYCEDLSENIRSVFRQKMKAGQYVGSFAPYGYVKDPKDNHKFLIDPYAASIVKRIYQLYVNGHSIRKICHELEDDGILNPTMHKKKQGLKYVNAKAGQFSVKYKFWSESTVKRILSNETYIGSLIQGTCQRASYKDKKIVSIPKEEWIVIENHHEPIIERELFYKVQRMFGQRRMEVSTQTKESKPHLLTGKIKCMSCKSSMIKSGGVRNADNDWYLRCQLANKSRLKECSSHNIRYLVVENVIVDHFRFLMEEALQDEQILTEILSLESEIDITKKLSTSHRLKLLNEVRQHTTNSIKQLYKDRLDGILSEEMFLQLKKEFEQDHKNVLSELNQISRKKNECDKNEPKIDHNNRIKSYYKQLKPDYEMIFDLLNHIEIGEKDEDGNQEILVYWKI